MARATPALFVAFDLLVDGKGRTRVPDPLSIRRAELEKLGDRAFTDHARGFLPSQIIFPPGNPGREAQDEIPRRLWDMDIAIEAVFVGLISGHPLDAIRHGLALGLEDRPAKRQKRTRKT